MAIISLPVLVGLAATGILIKIILSLLSKPASINPFRGNHVFEVKPRVTDQKKRDAVLKQGFTRDKVPENLDAIVIGSGLGGLSAAALLAKAGKKVLVLEQHDQAGGCCHTFIEKGYEFDVGIHYVGEMLYQSPSKVYLDQITNGQLEWEPLSEEYDEVIFAERNKEVRKYPVYSGEGKWEASLKKRFPEEAANIEKFFRLIDKVSKESQGSNLVKFLPFWVVAILQKTGLINWITHFFKWNAKSCKEVVWGITKNQELRDIFYYCYGDFGTPPRNAGFPMLVLLLKHYVRGGAYPKGGSSEMAFHIIPVIESTGGKVLVRAEVQEILVDNNRKAYGVKVKKGFEVINITAPIIISNAGLINTFRRMLPRSVASSSRLWPVMKKCDPSPGAMSVFVGLNSSAEDLEIYEKKNAWIYPGNDIDQVLVDYMKLNRDDGLDADIPFIFLSFPSTKDPEWSKRYPGKTTMVLITLMPYEWLTEWENERVMKRGDEYEAIKKTLGHKAIDVACKLFPKIRDHIDYINIGTPLSNRFYLGASKGECYGLDHNNERFSIWNNALLRPQTDVSGLYLTGQDTTSCGICGALWSGFLCASSVLHRNLMKDLSALQKNMESKQKSM